MTDQADIFEAIRSRFATQIGSGQSINVVYDNGPEPASITSSWCRFIVGIDNQEQISMGTVRYRLTGTATARLFTPIAKGDRTAMDLADAVVAAFRGVRLTSPDVIFTPPPGVIGTADQQDAWSILTVEIPFRADIQP
tara:strand:+ start:1355 stop:1768 length:414 start_codon:yes stop_codon:yes gene_type:complete